MTLKKLFLDFVLAAVVTMLLSLSIMLPASPAISQGVGGEIPPSPLVYFPSIFKNHATEELAFVLEKNPLDVDIYLTDSDGTFLKNLTNTPDCQEHRFAWSPDGSKLAYSSACDGDYGIYMMNSDGSGKNRLTGNMVYGYSLAWSMDGTQIAFDSILERNKDIYVVKADGSELTKLTDNPRTDTSPSWSPTDFNKIVFMCDINEKSDICVINNDGTGLTDLTKNIGFSALSDGASAWSPDGSKILFIATTGYYDTGIYVMNRDGSGITSITNNIGSRWDPTWSPDGKKIIFQYNGAIGVINIDGSGFKTLTTFTPNFLPVWSRDGTMIAFFGYFDSEEKVYVMNSDGTELRIIANLPGREYFPVWRP